MTKRKIIKIIKMVIVGIYLTVASQFALRNAIDVGIIHEDYRMILSFITGCINGLIINMD